MNKTLIIALSAIVGMIGLSFATNEFDFMSVLFGTGQAFLNCAVFYVVDRYGFAKVDTINKLELNDELYGTYMKIYGALVIAGYIIGYGLWS